MAYTGVKTLASSPYVVSRLVPDVTGEFDLAQLTLREGSQEQVLIHLLPPLQEKIKTLNTYIFVIGLGDLEGLLH